MGGNQLRPVTGGACVADGAPPEAAVAGGFILAALRPLQQSHHGAGLQLSLPLKMLGGVGGGWCPLPNAVWGVWCSLVGGGLEGFRECFFWGVWSGTLCKGRQPSATGGGADIPLDLRVPSSCFVGQVTPSNR